MADVPTDAVGGLPVAELYQFVDIHQTILREYFDFFQIQNFHIFKLIGLYFVLQPTDRNCLDVQI
jgi:hypothetical protein